ncbi:MAG TPA: peptidase, partial [Flavobacteriaceae bacterium]|nr:peptidase [Flavobacteriaceae bacterium]
MKIDFTHYQSAHCENGVVSNLLKHKGHDISEPMVFGIGSGLFFVYIPFLKVNHG